MEMQIYVQNRTECKLNELMRGQHDTETLDWTEFKDKL